MIESEILFSVRINHDETPGLIDIGSDKEGKMTTYLQQEPSRG